MLWRRGVPVNNNNMIDTIISVLESGNSVVLPATGFSMFPALRPGDLVHVRPFLKDEKPQIGNVLVFRDNDQLIVHRLVKFLQNEEGKDCFEARGDSRPASDKILPVQQIIGLAVSFKRAGKENTLKGVNPGKFRYMVNRSALWFFFKFKKLSYYFRLKFSDV